MALTPDEREELRVLRALRQAPSFERFVLARFPELAPVPQPLRKLYRLIDESRHRSVFCRVSMPPRFGKTTTFKAAVAYRMACDPADQHMYAASGDGLATDFAIGTRRMALRAGVTLARDQKAVQHFATAYGGGLKSASIFGDLVGRGVTGIAIGDDLLRTREAAESKLMRDKTFDSLRDNLYTRLSPGTGASLFLPATRWHEDDPHGRLERDGWGETWENVIIPAVTTPDGVPTDEITDDCLALCPERGFDLTWARKALARGPYGFWSLYQQQPRPRGGQMFAEPARFDLERWLAAGGLDGWRLVMALDPAATAKTSSDYSAGGVLALRGQGDVTEARPIAHFRVQEPLPRVVERCLVWQRRYGIPLWVEGFAQAAAYPDLIRSIFPGIDVRAIPRHLMKGGKLERATPWSVAWNDVGDAAAGRDPRVQVPCGEGWSGYIDEHRDFTGVNDAHDDQVDWTAHAWNLGYRAEDDNAGLVGGLPIAVGR